MSLIFAAITPHPPIIMPSIGKENAEKIKKTALALRKVEEELYLSKPQLIIIISPHGSYFDDAFSVNAETDFISNFEEFGDMNTKLAWKGSPNFAAQLAHDANLAKIDLRLVNDRKIDHGCSIPLSLLTGHLPDVKILPIGYSGQNARAHLDFGVLIKERIMESDKRVAIIASGDLSHCLNNEAPAGFNPGGEKFDKSVIELLENRNVAGLSNLDGKLVGSASECAYRSILVLLGALKSVNYTFKNYSYEAPFGVGYLTGNFVL
ncbi:MAG: AmmeMemoRadiSam system protein B [Patescibacteria group bacterium]